MSGRWRRPSRWLGGRRPHRLIASRFSTVGLFDDIADLDAVFAIDALTNLRIRDAIGQLQPLLRWDIQRMSRWYCKYEPQPLG